MKDTDIFSFLIIINAGYLIMMRIVLYTYGNIYIYFEIILSSNLIIIKSMVVSYKSIRK